MRTENHGAKRKGLFPVLGFQAHLEAVQKELNP